MAFRRNHVSPESSVGAQQSYEEAPDIIKDNEGKEFKKTRLDVAPGYTYVPLEEVSSGSNLQEQLVELQMIKSAASSTLNRADADMQKVLQQINEREEQERATVAAKEAQREREALARYTQSGLVQPNYRQQQNNNSVASANENISSRKGPNKKNLFIGIAAVSVVAAGGVAAYTATDGWKKTPLAAFGAGSFSTAEKVLSPDDLVAGECATDEAGNASAIASKELNVQAEVLWPITLANGDVTKIEVADEKNPDTPRNPYVQIKADSYLYACVPDADKKDFLKVDGSAISVDFSKVTPQIKIGNNKATDPVESIVLEEIKDEAGTVIVTKEVADAAVAGAKDPENILFLTQSAAAHAGVILADPGSPVADKVKEMFNQAKPEIITNLKAQAAALGFEDVSVDVKGEFKPDADYVGEAPKTSDKVSIDEKSLVIEPVVK